MFRSFAAVLEEDADRLRLVLADQRRIDVAAAQADVGADRAEDAAEGVGPLPRRRERADRAAAGAADAAVVAVLRELDRAGRRPSSSFSTSGSSSSSRNRA